MLLTLEKDSKFTPLIAHINRTRRIINASAATVFVIHQDKVVAEEYFGTHDHHLSSRDVQADSQFNIYSSRKSYVGLAVAMALYDGKINSLDDEIDCYFPEHDPSVLAGTTVRHLLTYSHGLYDLPDKLVRVAPAGTAWAYVNTGIDLLCQLVKRTTGQTVAQLIHEHVISPLQLTETGWRTQTDALYKLVPDIVEPQNEPFLRLETPDGDQRNLYVSAREFAYWGYLHLKKGHVNGVQVLPKTLFDWTTTVQSPPNWELQQNGFCWWLNDNRYSQSELGEHMPAGSFQILGTTGCACLVIPELDAVAVQMYNSRGTMHQHGYDYLRDIKDFGKLVVSCLTT